MNGGTAVPTSRLLPWAVGALALASLACPEKQSTQLRRAAGERKTADAGTDDDGPVPAEATVLTSGQNVPRDLHVDERNLYWLNEGRRVKGAPGVFMMPKAGGPPTALYTGRGVYALTVDEGHVYFIVPEALALYRVAKTGGEAEAIAKGQDGLSALAVDDTHVYWAGVDAIWRAPKGGGKAQPLAGNISVPMGLAIDGSTAWWYSVTAGKIARVSKKGGAAKPFSGDDLTFHAFFADEASLYWSVGSEKKAQIKRLPKSGGRPSVIAQDLDIPSDFFQNGGDVFWTTGDAIYRVPKTGGAVVKVIAGTDRAQSIAADGSRVYWTDRVGRIQATARR
jgi:hypothetical protein